MFIMLESVFTNMMVTKSDSQDYGFIKKIYLGDVLIYEDDGVLITGFFTREYPHTEPGNTPMKTSTGDEFYCIE